MKSMLLALALCLTFALGAPIKAQPTSYNLFGFGLPRQTRSAHLAGLGGSGTGIIDGRIINDLNPGSWSWLSRTRFEGDFRFGYGSSDFGGLASKDFLFQFGGFAFASPVWEKRRMAIALGVSPLTDATAQLRDSTGDEIRSYQSEGGVMMAYLGTSVALTQGVALGGRFDVLFGNLRRHSHIEFLTPTNAPGTFQRDYSMSGIRATLGASVIGDSLSPSLAGLGVGLAYTLPTSLTAKRRSIVTPTSATLDTTLETGGQGSYPGALNFGLSLEIGERYRVAADMRMEDFSSAYVFSETGDAPDPNLGATMRVGFGFERKANINREFGFTSGFDRLGYRLGFSYYQTPVKAAFGGVNEMAISLGLGIPMNFESLIDLSLEVGQRSPLTALSGPTDMFLRAGATLSLSERWFVPSRTDD